MRIGQCAACRQRRGRSRRTGLPPPGQAIADAPVFTRADAIETGDAAGKIDRAGAEVDALAFADIQARHTLVTGAPVDLQAEGGPLCEPSKQGAHRADGVAVEPAAPGGKRGGEHEHQRRNGERTHPRPMRFNPVETVETGGVRQTNDRIVRQRDQRTKQPSGDPPEIAVRIEQGQRETAPADDHPGHRAPEKPLPQPGFRPRVRQELLFSPMRPRGEARNSVLQNPERTDRRTIDAAHRESRDDDHDAGERKGRARDQGDQRRHQLHARQPAAHRGRHQIAKIRQRRGESGKNHQRCRHAEQFQAGAGHGVTRV